MIALIDGDVIVYRVGFASENQTEAQNCINCDLVMKDILAATSANNYRVFLSDKLENNFRYAIDNNYKANRKDAPKPKFYDSLRLFLQQEYKAEFTPGQEADDALGITQCEELLKMMGRTAPPKAEVSVICSIDKDLLQIPGLHYNLAKGVFTTVTHIEGIRHFYKQLLIGDRVDNITGVRGIGEVKSGKLLDPVGDELEMFEKVRMMYGDDERLLRNGRLLWVRRFRDEIWSFPDGSSDLGGNQSDSGEQNVETE